MNDQRVKTDNEVIAEFMGGTFEKREIMTVGGKRGGKWTFPNGTWLYDDQLRYSILWDHLMPVVEKIESLPNVYSFEIHIGATVRIETDISIEYLGGNLEALYKAVVQFIKWYQKQKSS